MRIAVLSDTHLKNHKLDLPQIVVEILKNMDGIIHCGDMKEEGLLDLLEAYGPVYAVHGNGDNEALRAKLKERLVIHLGDYKIGIVHGHGEKGKTSDRAFEAFEDMEVDIILYGHSHQPLLQTKKGILMVNPGSQTAKRREKKHSMVILNLGQNLHCEFIFF
ncbi:metallophosphoesterase family protein [Anaerosolibacter sp.]|uniref:metallophosphoesterase family protein n=1 Tax=Anaerosolibacter sp. TaxID=1872527 RepID=UPI0039EF4E52